MGRAPAVAVSLGEAAGTCSGGMPAAGADAVVMVEHTQPIDADTIEVTLPLAPGENVVQPGEDLRTEGIDLPVGHLLRPPDVGGLAALGIARVPVARRHTVAVLSMDEEVVSPENEPAVGQIRDVNSNTIASPILRGGAEPVLPGIVPDNYEEQPEVARRGLEHSDALVFFADSSVSARDMTVISSKPWAGPACWSTAYLSIPASPPSWAWWRRSPFSASPVTRFPPCSYSTCWSAKSFTTWPALPHSLNRQEPRRDWTGRWLPPHGREDYLPVRLRRKDHDGSEELVAEPGFGKCNLISTFIRAEDLVRFPLDKAVLYAGETVVVRLFQ